MKKLISSAVLALSLTQPLYAQQHGAHGMGGMHHRHMQTMPMLHGINTSQQEFEDMREMFQRHLEIERTVENIEGGIRTFTASKNPELRDAIVNHVAMMITRVEDGNDPEVPIQSPTLSILFALGNQIDTEIEVTEDGIIVTQTSSNPIVAQALQTHAAEVTDLAERGMQSVHERMMGH